MGQKNNYYKALESWVKRDKNPPLAYREGESHLLTDPDSIRRRSWIAGVEYGREESKEGNYAFQEKITELEEDLYDLQQAKRATALKG